ncbi:NUDIX domain-containing protein [Micromonospora carbonacea subsp. aurantiaca]|uniref:NUDIX domain-containing protein n=1 Tax=Micromonospora carbonacea TaxID=47853 RepID=A0A7H8XVF5_9ACTN|nr:NUDIX domain-containing protein [Micromonospora carbonacea]
MGGRRPATDDEQYDQSGLQVPAGTVRDGELLEQAVLREAFEETALHGLRIERYLGVTEWDVRPYADAVHVRRFFHLSVEGAEVPDRWIAMERGDGDGEPIRFELYWLPLAQGHVLAAGQLPCSAGCLIDLLRAPVWKSEDPSLRGPGGPDQGRKRDRSCPLVTVGGTRY